MISSQEFATILLCVEKIIILFFVKNLELNKNSIMKFFVTSSKDDNASSKNKMFFLERNAFNKRILCL